MASLQQLLAEEGLNFRATQSQDDSISLPIFLCSNRKSSGFDRPRIDRSSRRRRSSESSMRTNADTSEPGIDDAAIRAVVSILSGYIGKYSKDRNFREVIKEKCCECFTRNDNEVLENIKMAIENVESIAERRQRNGPERELELESLENSIKLLSIVESLTSSTCEAPNSNLSACAQLYLSIIYKLQRNNRISARHLLQVFIDSPSLSRAHLLPDLWEHMFLPHLLHLKIWYINELESLSSGSSSSCIDREKKIRCLKKIYDDRMDVGTRQFALYYKKWLKIGAEPPPVPSVPLPLSRRKSSGSFTSISSVNNNNNNSLYSTVFGHDRDKSFSNAQEGTYIMKQDMIHKRSGSWSCRKPEAESFSNAEGETYIVKRDMIHRRSGSYSQSRKQTDYFRLFTCQSEAKPCLVKDENIQFSAPDNVGEAISTISSSESLIDCEMAIRLLAKAWLDSNGDPKMETALSNATVVEGIMEILLASNDDEVLELGVSILAELVARKWVNGQVISNSDPQLEIFERLLRNSSVFLKAAALLYLVKPKAKQMVSLDWIALVLRVLEFGDQLQTLFTVRCSPQTAAYYFLEQLLTGFDEDKNSENMRQLITLGGLSLLVKRIEKTKDVCEKSKAVNIMLGCIRADGSCRHYLARTLNKDNFLPLLVFRDDRSCQENTFGLLAELLCLHKQSQRTEFLKGLLSGCLNIMHCLLVYLQRAQPEKKPIVAAVLLQLDLLGDATACSVYREEVLEELIKALDCRVFNEKLQEQSAKALLILGGKFSYTGQPLVEQWLLKQAGFDDFLIDSYYRRNNISDEYMQQSKYDELLETWQRKTATVLLIGGNTRLLEALADSIANGMPCLARASLATLSWMSNFFHLVNDTDIQSAASSILIPLLKQLLNRKNYLEERLLSSYSLLGLAKKSESIRKMVMSDKDLTTNLRKLSDVASTAKELISIISSHQH